MDESNVIGAAKFPSEDASEIRIIHKKALSDQHGYKRSATWRGKLFRKHGSKDNRSSTYRNVYEDNKERVHDFLAFSDGFEESTVFKSDPSVRPLDYLRLEPRDEGERLDNAGLLATLRLTPSSESGKPAMSTAASLANTASVRIFTRKRRQLPTTDNKMATNGRTSPRISALHWYVDNYSRGHFNLNCPPPLPVPPKTFQFFFPAPLSPLEGVRTGVWRIYEDNWLKWARAVLEQLPLVASANFDAPFVSVSFFDEWEEIVVVSNIAEQQTLERRTSISAHAVLSDRALVVLDTLTDWRFAGNVLVTGKPHIRFFAGAPLLTEEGYAIGVLSLFDRKPHDEFGAQKRRDLEELAATIMKSLHRETHMCLQDEEVSAQHIEAPQMASIEIPRLTPLLQRNSVILGDYIPHSTKAIASPPIDENSLGLRFHKSTRSIKPPARLIIDQYSSLPYADQAEFTPPTSSEDSQALLIDNQRDSVAYLRKYNWSPEPPEALETIAASILPPTTDHGIYSSSELTSLNPNPPNTPVLQAINGQLPKQIHSIGSEELKAMFTQIEDELDHDHTSIRRTPIVGSVPIHVSSPDLAELAQGFTTSYTVDSDKELKINVPFEASKASPRRQIESYYNDAPPLVSDASHGIRYCSPLHSASPGPPPAHPPPPPPPTPKHKLHSSRDSNQRQLSRVSTTSTIASLPSPDRKVREAQVALECAEISKQLGYSLIYVVCITSKGPDMSEEELSAHEGTQITMIAAHGLELTIDLNQEQHLRALRTNYEVFSKFDTRLDGKEYDSGILLPLTTRGPTRTRSNGFVVGAFREAGLYDQVETVSEHEEARRLTLACKQLRDLLMPRASRRTTRLPRRHKTDPQQANEMSSMLNASHSEDEDQTRYEERIMPRPNPLEHFEEIQRRTMEEARQQCSPQVREYLDRSYGTHIATSPTGGALHEPDFGYVNSNRHNTAESLNRAFTFGKRSPEKATVQHSTSANQKRRSQQHSPTKEDLVSGNIGCDQGSSNWGFGSRRLSPTKDDFVVGTGDPFDRDPPPKRSSPEKKDLEHGSATHSSISRSHMSSFHPSSNEQLASEHVTPSRRPKLHNTYAKKPAVRQREARLERELSVSTRNTNVPAFRRENSTLSRYKAGESTSRIPASPSSNRTYASSNRYPAGEASEVNIPDNITEHDSPDEQADDEDEGAHRPIADPPWQHTSMWTPSKEAARLKKKA